ncbi:MAG: hypothetical protein KBG15_17465, partial [Kofleriaceae bacterium]|nr:hypothetical protein [Kofleriaceae bacterium]
SAASSARSVAFWACNTGTVAATAAWASVEAVDAGDGSAPDGTAGLAANGNADCAAGRRRCQAAKPAAPTDDPTNNPANNPTTKSLDGRMVQLQATAIRLHIQTSIMRCASAQ